MLAASLVVFSSSFAQQPSPPTLISIASTGEPGNAWSGAPSISADGRFVAFASQADNLVPGDTNGVADIFVRDRLTGQTVRVSVSTQGEQANAASARPAISGNGRFVAFESLASNLVPGDTNGVSDIFVHDRLTGQTRRVSVGKDGQQADGWSEQVSISYDGRYLAYQTLAGNLVRGDDNEDWDVYIYDNGVTGNVIRASVSSEREGGEAASYAPAISGDGRIIAFVSEADNLVPGDTNGQPDVFVYHRVLAQTTRVSVDASGGQIAGGAAFAPDISFSGRSVAFAVRNDQGVQIYRRDRQENTTTLLASLPFTEVVFALAANGRALLYRGGGEGGELVWKELRGGETRPVSAGAGGFALSADGGLVVYGARDAAYSQVSMVALNDLYPAAAYFVAGQITGPLGQPLALVTVTDPFGNRTRTGLDGRFWLSGYPAGDLTLTFAKEGYSFQPSVFRIQLSEDVADVAAVGMPLDVLDEARLDLGMPYNFDRGCPDPFVGCGGPFHGFYAGYCTDLVLDAYTFGVDFDIQFDLEQDANANPAHFYRWRNARNTHDMWRFFSYTGQMLPNEAPYLPGDIVFFDWTEDGEIDHVALVSEVDENGRPTMLLDATGVIEQNPSGLAAELEWQPFHERTVRGHARWSGAYQPFVPGGFPQGLQVLQIALSGGGLDLRLVDGAGNALSATENSLPRGAYYDLVWERTAAVLDPLATGGQFSLEIRSQSDQPVPFWLTIQVVDSGRFTGRVESRGTLPPGGVKVIPIMVRPAAEGGLLLEAAPSRAPKIKGIFIKP